MPQQSHKPSGQEQVPGAIRLHGGSVSVDDSASVPLERQQSHIPVRQQKPSPGLVSMISLLLSRVRE